MNREIWGSQWRSEVQTPNPRAGSKGYGLLSRALESDLALFVPGQRTEQVQVPARRVEFQVPKKISAVRELETTKVGSGAKPARERGFSLDPYRSRTPVQCFMAPCLMPFDANFRPLIPSLSFPHALTKVLQAQVSRAARSWRPRRWLVVSSTYRAEVS